MKLTIRVKGRSKLTGDEIIAWRKSLGWSRKKAADELAVPFYTYRQWERDKCSPPAMLDFMMHVLTVSEGVGTLSQQGRSVVRSEHS